MDVQQLLQSPLTDAPIERFRQPRTAHRQATRGDPDRLRDGLFRTTEAGERNGRGRRVRDQPVDSDRAPRGSTTKDSRRRSRGQFPVAEASDRELEA